MKRFVVKDDFYLDNSPFKIWELYTSLHQLQYVVFTKT
ncbi:hypothetical protein Sp14A_02070 [Streptococcus pluranimalium]|uniref:Uncharacterized protein n=1 Tax=Streptococcus pluranimalium TaxID=82348 RepID=A0A345VHF9_9STRE|nr:hypothetical protein Sp14A_02070 [Streptococcus pluranimalium]